MNRRTTFMLAMGGVASVAAQSRAARAEQGTAERGEIANKPDSPNQKTAPASQVQNLRAIGSEHHVVAIHHRDNSFEITTFDGRSEVILGINLRIKIDSSGNGPPAGKPVILPGGMMGDRATLFFASPAEMCDLIQG